MPDDLSGWGSEEGLSVDRRLDRHEWRLDSLDRWRRDVSRTINVLQDGIDDLNEANRIAKAVAEELGKKEQHGEPVSISHGLAFTWYQKLGAFVGGALLLADALRGLIAG